MPNSAFPHLGEFFRSRPDFGTCPDFGRTFPHTHVVVNAMDPTLTNALLAMSPRLGLRADCLGEHDMFSIIPSSPKSGLVANRWKSAPVLSEWCHSTGTSTARGASQVRAYHVSMVSSGNVYPSYASMSSPMTVSGILSPMLPVALPPSIQAWQSAPLGHPPAYPVQPGGGGDF